MPATRDSAPASFCSSIEIIRLIGKSRSLLALASEHFRRVYRMRRRDLPRRDMLAGDHLRVAHAGTDHRIHAGVGIDHDLEKCGTCVGDELGNRLRDVGGTIQPPRPTKAIGFCSLDEVLFVQTLVAGGEAALEEQFLPLPHHAIALIVEYD